MNANKWISGTTYAEGDAVWSTVDYQTYRRKTNGAGTTDPSVDGINWEKVGKFGIHTATTLTTSATLTITPQVVHAVPSTSELTITLPDATTASVAGETYIIKNSGQYTVVIRDNDGVAVGFLQPGNSTSIGLLDNSTTAGEWLMNGADHIGIIATTSMSSIYTSDVLSKVSLDADRDVIFFVENSATLYALVFNRTTLAYGNMTAIRTISEIKYNTIKTATDTIMVVSVGTVELGAVLLTINDSTITVNTAATATLAGGIAAFTTDYGESSICMAGSSVVFGYSRATNVTACRAVTISGVTCTIGAERSLSGTYTSTCPQIAPITSSTVLAVSAVNASQIYVQVLILSGSTLTAGVYTNLVTTEGWFKMRPLGTRFALVYQNTTCQGAILSVSGTTVTESHGTIHNYSSGDMAEKFEIIDGKAIVTHYSASTDICYIGAFYDNAGTIGLHTTAQISFSYDPGALNILFSSGTNKVALGTQRLNQILYMYELDLTNTALSITPKAMYDYGENQYSPFYNPPILTSETKMLGSATQLKGGYSDFFIISDFSLTKHNTIPILGSVGREIKSGISTQCYVLDDYNKQRITITTLEIAK